MLHSAFHWNAVGLTETKSFPPAKQEIAPPKPSLALRTGAFLDHYGRILAVLLVILASVRIVATYSVFSHVVDEPAHVACGMEWLDRGVYRYEAQHPPLARVAAALGPYLLGRRSQGITGDENAMSQEGLAILYQGGDYDRTLAWARAGMLPFFWVACFVVYAWASRDFGPRAALAALFLFTFLPPVLAHAGLATTDMALTPFLGAAFLAGRVWLERPTLGTGALFGVCSALAVLSKFSTLAFFPAIAALALAWYFASGKLPSSRVARIVKELLPSFALAAAIVCLMIWGAYRFSFGKVDFANVRLPAPEFYRGIREVVAHNAKGHMSYPLGEVSKHGFWSFYFVVLAVKTPIAFLLLLGAGIGFAARSWRQNAAVAMPLAFAAGILVVSLFSRINIGVRHILPIYMAFSILAAYGVIRLLESAGARKWLPGTIVLLLGWLTVSSILGHPDYLPYFNEFGGNHPEKILVDSDLDWGQDMKRLAARLHDGGARVLTLEAFYWINRGDRRLPVIRKARPDTPLAGWNAVALSAWKEYRFGFEDHEPSRKFWPDALPPQEVVGKSIYL